MPLKRIITPVQEFIQALRIEGSFAQNLAISFSGNAAAQVLGFAFTPFIARMYGPEAYGVFALCMAVTSNLFPISTLQFPSGYVAAENDQEFFNLIKITFLALIGSTVAISIVLLFLGEQIIEIFHVQYLQNYLYIIPLYLLFMGADNILVGWSIRLKEFKLSAWAKMISIISGKTTTLLWGIFLTATPTGIIVGNLLIYPIDNLIKVLGKIKSDFKNIFNPTTSQQLIQTFKKFKGYPLYITPGLIISNLSAQLPIYYFSIHFFPADVGLFAMAITLVSTPLSMVISSSTSVFLQKAAETKQNNVDSLGTLTLFLYKRLFFVGLIPLTILSLISTWVFQFLLGDAWAVAGTFASYISIGAIFSVPALPLSVLFRLLNSERTNLILNIGFVVAKFVALWIGIYYNNLELAIICFSFVTMLSYVVTLSFIFKIVNQPRKILLMHSIVVVLLFAGIVILKG